VRAWRRTIHSQAVKFDPPIDAHRDRSNLRCFVAGGLAPLVLRAQIGHAKQGLAAASAILLRRQQAREIAKTQRPCFAMRATNTPKGTCAFMYLEAFDL
jgi:hypothetical protein